jgi:periplasmic divalent cation tolerance protein
MAARSHTTVVMCSATFPVDGEKGGTGGSSSARKAIDSIVEHKLAACAQQLSEPVESTYFWKGQKATSREVVVWFKTALDRVDQLMQAIASTHPYENPEVLCFTAEKATLLYSHWVASAVGL